jgi:hypothetical protein
MNTIEYKFIAFGKMSVIRHIGVILGKKQTYFAETIPA